MPNIRIITEEQYLKPKPFIEEFPPSVKFIKANELYGILASAQDDGTEQLYVLLKEDCPHCPHPLHTGRCEFAVPIMSAASPNWPAEVIAIEQCDCGATEEELNP